MQNNTPNSQSHTIRRVKRQKLTNFFLRENVKLCVDFVLPGTGTSLEEVNVNVNVNVNVRNIDVNTRM